MKPPPAAGPQPDGTPEPLNKPEKPRQDEERPPTSTVDGADDHIGATENQVTDTSPPAGEAYDDEPKQG